MALAGLEVRIGCRVWSAERLILVLLPSDQCFRERKKETESE